MHGLFHKFCWIGLLAAVLSATACSSRVQRTLPVTGTVHIDGKPVARGMIGFEAQDGAAGLRSAVVLDGQFTCELPSGTWIVGVADDDRRKIYKDPQSPLTAVVILNSKNHFEFEISSGTK